MQIIKVAINGFGRIGRAFFRLAYENNKSVNQNKIEKTSNNNDIFKKIESAKSSINSTETIKSKAIESKQESTNKIIKITHINDVSNFSNLSYLLKNDTIFGTFSHKVELRDNRLLISNDNFGDEIDEIIVSNANNPNETSFGEVDLVLECSGKFLDTQNLMPYIKNGAKKVILGAPPKDNMPIFVFGVNEDKYSGEKIISNASCSSNAIAPIIFAIKQKHQILGGNITTIHPFNSDQVLLDNAHLNDLRLSRNATQNILPTKSSIGFMIERLFGDSVGRFYGDSIRIPTSIVSFSNIDLMLENKISKDEILELNFNPRIIGFDLSMLVSSDFIKDSRSAIIPTDLIKINGKLCRISLWFDNESGYANRLLDMAKLIYKA